MKRWVLVLAVCVVLFVGLTLCTVAVELTKWLVIYFAMLSGCGLGGSNGG